MSDGLGSESKSSPSWVEWSSFLCSLAPQENGIARWLCVPFVLHVFLFCLQKEDRSRTSNSSVYSVVVSLHPQPSTSISTLSTSQNSSSCTLAPLYTDTVR